MNQPTQNPEEIDIIQFFKTIGKMFNNLFESTKKLLSNILYLFLDLLLYIKKYYIYFIGIILLGLIVAFVRKPRFAASMVVETNYGSQASLQEKFNYFNSLIDDDKFELLAKSLDISTEQAETFKSFEIEPELNDVLMIRDYSDRLKKLDSAARKFFKYGNYKKSIKKNKILFPFWKIEVIATDPKVFFSLNDKFEEILDNNLELVAKRDHYVASLEISKKKILRSLSEIDSLRNVFNTVMLKSAEKEASGGTNILMSSGNLMRGPETSYNLFASRAQELKNLQNYVVKIDRFKRILILKNKFPAYGEKGSGWRNPYIKFPVLGVLLLLLILIMKDFIAYLDKYQKRKKSTE